MQKPRDLLVRQLFPIPDIPAPLGLRCVSVYIPDSMDHLAIFAGALALLGKWNSWEKDAAHNARLCALAWQKALYLGIRDCDTGQSIEGFTLEDDMSDNIRIDPDNECIIQIKCCGEWTTLIDISKCVPSGLVQPTDGTPLPSGSCRSWDVSLRANEKWLIPLALNEGDTVEVTGATGAWNDGTLGWNCVNGMTFGFGACVGADAPDPTDPLQTVNHMRLIMSVDGVYTDAYNTIYAVPSGVSDGQGFLQANDGTLSDNSGTVSFRVTVCTQSAAPAGVTFTYDWGSGPTTLDFVSGQERIVSFTATATPGYVNNYGVAAHFSGVLEVSFVSETGFVLVVSGVTWGGVFNMYPTLNPALTAPAQTVPSQLPPNSPGNGFQCNTGTGGAPFTITVKLKMP
jgi:hypothetical protein